MELTLVILAAGAGSRYGGLKQLAPIGPRGEALLEYSAFDAGRAGFSRVVLVVRAEHEEEFRRRFADGMGRRLELAFVRQGVAAAGLGTDSGRRKPWGTGHAVLAAEKAVGGPFAVINADDFYGATSFTALGRFLGRDRREPLSLAMVGFRVAHTVSDAGPVSRALCRLDGDGRLSEIVELKAVWKRDAQIVYRGACGAERPLDGDELVSMNMWGCGSAIFAELRQRFDEFLVEAGTDLEAEFLLPDVVRALVRERRARVEVLAGAGRWCGITFRRDEQRARQMLAELVARGRYPEDLWQ